MNILVNGIKVDALCSVVHRSIVEKEGREWAKRLQKVVPRQQFEVVIQAAVGSTIVARERVAPMRKDVTAGLYGGHYERKVRRLLLPPLFLFLLQSTRDRADDSTRQMKHLVKQREGKKRLKERSIGRVSIPTSAFFAVLGGATASRRKGQGADK